MLRWPSVLLAVCLALAGCGPGDDSSEDSAEPRTPAPLTSIAEEEPPTTTSAVAATTTTEEPTTTEPPPTTLVPPADLEAGLFCRDLNAVGYSYADSVTYWVKEGRPDRMDADRNGIPCETVYPEGDVLAFWGDPLPTTTEDPSIAAADIAQYAGEQWTAATGDEVGWECLEEHGSQATEGLSWVCIPDDVGEGEHPVLTALVLDGEGTIAIAQSGTWMPELAPGVVLRRVGSGLLCRDVLDPETGLMEWVNDPAHRYFGAVLYWLEEGRPDRMDADLNGIPCETLVDPSIVAGLWNGGIVGPTWYTQMAG